MNINKRFSGYYPVIVDLETSGFNPKKNAILEIAAVTIRYDSENGIWVPNDTKHIHVLPFEGAELDPEALKFNGIDPYHPFRFAVPENEALKTLFSFLEEKYKQAGCRRCVMVAHNAWFDQSFMLAAINRWKIEKSPFHKFTCFDTATLAGLFYRETVLAKAFHRAKIEFDQKEAHSALYDASKTAELFCKMLNIFDHKKFYFSKSKDKVTENNNSAATE